MMSFQVSNDGEFDWSSQQQGLVLSGFSYGYCATQLIGGILAERYGGKWVFGIAIGGSTVLGVLVSFVAHVDFTLVVVVRALQGALQGCCNPALHALVARWIPMQEKATLFTFIQAGEVSRQMGYNITSKVQTF